MTMYYSASHEEIVNSAATLHPAAAAPEPASLNGDTLVNAARRVVTVFQALIPFLMTLSSAQFLPATLRGGLTILIQALDVLAAAVSLTPASPVTASLASDGTTTTDPTSTDPSFKAGKDL
jgi:hypothetical protein